MLPRRTGSEARFDSGGAGPDSTASRGRRVKIGVADGNRTRDHRSHNPVLYQLSYSHHCYWAMPPAPPMCRTAIDIAARMLRASGAPGRIRTCDPRLRRPLLYPAELRARSRPVTLSEYTGCRWQPAKLVGEEGFEPPTSCSQSRRATRLRYSPVEPRASEAGSYAGPLARSIWQCLRSGCRVDTYCSLARAGAIEPEAPASGGAGG